MRARSGRSDDVSARGRATGTRAIPLRAVAARVHTERTLTKRARRLQGDLETVIAQSAKVQRDRLVQTGAELAGDGINHRAACLDRST